MNPSMDYWTARALLDWHVEMGAEEPILDAPVDRYALPMDPPWAKPRLTEPEPSAAPDRASAPSAAAPDPRPTRAPPPAVPAQPSKADQTAAAVAEARARAAAAPDLAALAQAMAEFDQCEIKRGARKFVFADGLPAARVMIIGDPPTRDEDVAGRPFAGPAGVLLDRMLAAIELSRDAPDPDRAAYLVPVLPWRTPSDRPAEPDEIAMMRPFLERHITLANPRVVVLMGNTPCRALLGRDGITRLRGQWAEVLVRPAVPMVDPAYLLANPGAKREAWADLLALQARLRGLSGATT